ncbi:hypothetical protein HK101_005278, partial [Irineochytrium annulatum]
MATLTNFLPTLIAPDCQTLIKDLPSVSGGVVGLASPFYGSDIIVRDLVRLRLLEIGFDVNYIELSAHDLFPRMSGGKVMAAPPLRRLKANGPFDGYIKRKGGVVRNGVVVFGIPEMEDDDDGSDRRDVLDVPYPWFRKYEGRNGRDQLVLPSRYKEDNQVDDDSLYLLRTTLWTLFSEVTAHAGKTPTVIFLEDFMRLLELSDVPADKIFGVVRHHLRGMNVTVIAPFTPTLRGKHSTDSIIGGLYSRMHEDDDDDDDDGPPPMRHPAMGGVQRRPPPPKYDTILDNYLGASVIPIYPPVHQGARGVGDFHERCRKEARLVLKTANARELGVVWPRDAEMVDFEFDEEEARKNMVGRVWSDRLVSPNEAERVVSYAKGFAKADGREKINWHDFKKATELGAKNVMAGDAVKVGVEFAGIFANPTDAIRLSNHEKNLLNQCLVKPGNFSTKFGSIGGLGKTKDTINELIRLPLQRPELFSYGVLKQSTTGILLFGPPGTGKTMLARAVAAESGANFLNVQMSTMQSMWVGESEKLVKALFSLARKLRPCVIFADEIDALLKVRTRGQPGYQTNMINEFMQEWDGIQAEHSKGVMVVGATNRPFDLDEAVLRRLPRRIMVNLPNIEERREILSIMLKDEYIQPVASKQPPNRDNRKAIDEARGALLDAVAAKTEGFSGSDLKNLCIAAALRAVRSFAVVDAQTGPSPRVSDADETQDVETDEKSTRTLTLDEFEAALESGEVVPSLDDKAELMKQLKTWDKQYGTGSGG